MADTSPFKVVIGERNPLVVAGLCDLLERDKRFIPIRSVPTGSAFLETAETTAFDVAILAWKLSDMDGGDVFVELKRRQANPRVVIFSSDQDIDILKQCIRLGVPGFCSQFDDPCILLDTLQAVAHGRICIPYIDVTKVNDSPLSALTTRERELLGVLADGWTNLQIAARTGISENTVKYHLKNLYEKLDVRNRAMAVALYAKEIRRRPSGS